MIMMTAFMDILQKDIIERDNSYKRIKNFLNKRKERRPLEQVKQFIKNELSGHYMYKINDVHVHRVHHVCIIYYCNRRLASRHP